jgi:hypothetical protein
MKEQGKVRWIGIGWGVFDTFQIPCSALERQPEELIQLRRTPERASLFEVASPASNPAPAWAT